MKPNTILEHLITNILGGYDDTPVALPKDIEFLRTITNEVDFILHILTTWSTPRDLGIVWFGISEQQAFTREDKISKGEIFEMASKIWDNMAQALASTNTTHPANYTLPPVRIVVRRTRMEYERDQVLGWHHLGVVYPMNKLDAFLKEAKQRIERMEQQELRQLQSQGILDETPSDSISNTIIFYSQYINLPDNDPDDVRTLPLSLSPQLLYSYLSVGQQK